MCDSLSGKLGSLVMAHDVLLRGHPAWGTGLDAKHTLKTEPGKTTVTGGGEAGGAACEESRRRPGVRPPPFRTRGALVCPSPRPAPLAPRQRQGAWGRDGCSNPGGMATPRTKHTFSSSSSAGKISLHSRVEV